MHLVLLVPYHTARRAVESELPDAYIHDYLARGLCGKEALEGARQVRGDPGAREGRPPCSLRGSSQPTC